MRPALALEASLLRHVEARSANREADPARSVSSLCEFTIGPLRRNLHTEAGDLLRLGQGKQIPLNAENR